MTSSLSTILPHLASAYIGGLILNAMPCVLPVLSMKVFHLVGAQSRSLSYRLSHGLLYTTGVLSTFLILAIIMLALREGGQLIGWGFHFQSPYVLIGMTALLTAIGLNLLGVFEVGTSLMALGNVQKPRYTLLAPVFDGVLASVVATPCTAPFMGTALGFALTQTPAVALLVFAFLGLGMASPLVLVLLVPRILPLLPKPGRWMETFKQFLAFPMFGTAVWILWIFGNQTSHNAATALLAALVVLGLTSWWYGKLQYATAGLRRSTGKTVALVLGFVAFALPWSMARETSQPPKEVTSQPTTATTSTEIAWKPYTKSTFDELLASGAPVFLDFTADWCITCKVNERVTFKDPAVNKFFADHRIAALMADWTNQDPEITKALASYGRNSLPLYVLAKTGQEPLILPELLTPQILLGAMAKYLGKSP